MSSNWMRVTVLPLALAVGACAPAQEAADEPAVDPAVDAAAIEAVRAAEADAAEAGDTDAFLALMTDDIIAMPPNEGLITGKDALRAWLDGFTEQFDVTLEPYVTDEVEVSGDLAFERFSGVWTLTPKDGGESVTENLRGIHIYRRQADGSWKIARDVWNSSDPLPEM